MRESECVEVGAGEEGADDEDEEDEEEDCGDGEHVGWGVMGKRGMVVWECVCEYVINVHKKTTTYRIMREAGWIASFICREGA